MYQEDNMRGLPRPLAKDPRDMLRPVPWTQRADSWGSLDENRQWDCGCLSLCLVCGEFVEYGVVFWNIELRTTPPTRVPAPMVVTYEGLSNRRVSDHGPLHDRCGKITRSHCQTVRRLVREGEVVVVPYEGPMVYGYA